MQRVPDLVCLTPDRSCLYSTETHETSLVQLSCRDVISEGAGQATTVVQSCSGPAGGAVAVAVVPFSTLQV